MITFIFILSSVGLGLYSSYFFYRQVYFGIVRSPKEYFWHVGVMSASSTLLWAAGFFISDAITAFQANMSWMSVVIFFFAGLRLFTNIKKTKTADWTFQTASFRTLLLFSLSVTFDAFFLGFAVGLLLERVLLFVPAFLIIVGILQVLAGRMAMRQTATLSTWLIGVAGVIMVGISSLITLAWLLL